MHNRDTGEVGPAATGTPRQTRRALVFGLAAGAAGGLGPFGSAALLAACAAPGQGSAAEPGSRTEVTGRVVLWFLAQFRFDTDLGAQLIQEVESRNPKLKIVPEEITGDRFEKLKVAAAAGSAPDIGQAGYWQMQELGAAGIAAPVDSYLKASPVVKAGDLWPTIVRDLSWKGKQYGMPFAPGIAVMYVHLGAMTAAGLDPTKPARSWEELEQHLPRLYRAGTPEQPGRLGFHPLRGQGDGWAWLVPFWQLGGEALGADGAKVTINNELGIRTLEWLQTLVKAQGGWDAVTGALEPSKGVVGTFTNGRLGYLYETSDQPARDDFKNAQGLQYGVTSYPLPKNGKRVALGGCHAFCITTQSKVPEGAWRFLEHLATDASSLRFAQRYRGIPVRVSTARSAAFQQNDPLLKQAVDEMNYVRWLIPAPGGTEMAGLYKTMPENVMAGKLSIRDALADTERQMQLVLDTWKR